MIYLRAELLRNARNWRFVIFSLIWPLILYVTITSANRHARFDGTSFPLYFMAGMAAMGTMIAIISGGARIALERSVGWTRQLRITPLTARAYFRAKLLCAYLMALLTIVVMAGAGLLFGVRLPVTHWLTLAGLLLVGLIPFAVLGLLLGHVLGADTLTPVVGGITTVFALVGGAYGFLIASHGAIFDVMKAIPSYWLVQAGHAALGGQGWPAEAWIVIAAWTVVLIPLAVAAYRRDTARA